DNVAKAFPGITPDQRAYFTDQLFAGKEIRSVKPILHGATVTDDSAKMPVDFRITFSQKGTASPTTFNLPYLASFTLVGGKWKLAALQPRR
ncbi:MAG TPA: hypothetical protein VFJ20_04310, partial [Gemmatimonadaceae bacterium]|nr:hypothetical protein [Gemmatimonadaceae bacterium]